MKKVVTLPFMKATIGIWSVLCIPSCLGSGFPMLERDIFQICLVFFFALHFAPRTEVVGEEIYDKMRMKFFWLVYSALYFPN